MPMIFDSLTILLALFTVAEGNGCENQQIVEIGRRSILNCSFSEGFVGIMWYNSTNFEDDPPILVFQHSEKSGQGYASGEFDILPSGSLIINNVSIMHETVFVVSQIINFKDPVKWHSVKVITYVTPNPPHPVVDECNHQQYCVIVVEHGDTLTCRLLGIRPITHLEWIPSDQRYQSMLQNQTLQVIPNGDTSDVYVTVRLFLTQYIDHQTTVVCRTKGLNSDMWNMNTIVDLRFFQENSVIGDSPTNKSAILWIIIVSAVVLIIIAIIILIRATFKYRADRKSSTKSQKEDVEETVPMNEPELPTADSQINDEDTTDLNFAKLDLGSKRSSTPDFTILGLASFSSADQHNITLDNGKLVPVSSTLEELQIKTNNGKEFTQDQVIGLMLFAQRCQRLRKLSFINCVLPLSLHVGSLSPLTKLRDIQVSWTPTEHGFHLDSFRGKWVSNSKEATTLETNGQNSLRLLCSSIVFLSRTDSKELQISTILLLEIASSHNIPISELRLRWSFSGFDGKDIRLESGLSLSSLSSVEKISINEKGEGNTLSKKEVIELINYGMKSPRFKQLWLLNCKLPSSIKPDIIPEESRSRNIKVISSSESRYLDLKSGQWMKPDDIQTITEMCSGDLAIHRDTSEPLQRSVIELLVEASNHDIPIHRMNLVWSFSKIDEDGNIILSSGLSLPVVTSIEKMNICTETGREMNKHEVNGILNYLQHSQRFKILYLSQCLLPSSIPIDPSLSALKSRGVKVYWIPDNKNWDQQYLLNLNTGRWEKNGSW